MRSQVLVVDSPERSGELARVLASEYEVRAVHEAGAAIETLRTSLPALIISNVELPIVDGVELCRRARRMSTIPIIVVSTCAETELEVAALDAGADDYITAPVCNETLLARVRSALRRTTDAPPRPDLEVGDFYIDFANRRVRLRGQRVRLTPKEFDLFVFMAKHPTRVLEHRRLLTAVWGEACQEHSEYLRVFVGQLRRKMEPDLANPRYFQTEPWVGYRFSPTGMPHDQPPIRATVAAAASTRSVNLSAM
jgi:two-component system, OmpR family, KDP operon response regulator KdpE